MATFQLEVRISFSQRRDKQVDVNTRRTIAVAKDGSDSVFEVKKKIAAAFGGNVQPHDLQLYFSPNEAIIGQHYKDDPAVDESSTKLLQYSCLLWLQRYPHWHLSARFMPPVPLPPGVAAHRAAALSEGKDPDLAVRDARAKGELPNLTSLPKPWGPKKYEPIENDHSHNPPAAFSMQELKLK